MQLRIFKEGLGKMLNICSKNGFFDIKPVENTLISLQYGPLGSLLRKNISREWLSSIMNNSDAHMFPIEVQVLKEHSRSVKGLSISSDLLSGLFKNYLKILPVIGAENPCGFATYGPSISLNNNNLNPEEVLDVSLQSSFMYRHWLWVVFFCPTKKSADWFNYWSTYRYRWWRRFSSIPSNFFMSDVTQPTIGEQQISLMMEFPWGKEKLETVTLYNEKSLQNEANRETGSEKNCNTSIIICEAELDVAAFAYLTNSFVEMWMHSEFKNLFQLHVKLAPYKVAIFLKCEDSIHLKKLEDTAKHLERELKKYRVAVYPCSYIDLVNGNLEFSKPDEMGIPYTVILTKGALDSGFAGLRNRDTTLEEQIHITELTPTLLKYLQMKSLDVDE